MKSFSKFCLIFSGSVIAIGLVLCIAGSIIGGGRLFIDAVSDGRFSFGNYYSPITVGDLKDVNEEFSNIKEISLNISYGDLNFASYEGDVVKVDAQDVKKSFDCSKEDDELIISDDDRNRKYRTNYHPIITILVPEDKLDEIDMNLGAGYINVNNLYTKELTVKIGAGEFIGENFNVNSCDIKVGTGNLDINGINADEMELDCGIGSADISGDIDREIEVKCAMGNVMLELEKEESYYSYDISCGMGEVSIGNNNYSDLDNKKHISNKTDNVIDIDCGMGNVMVDFEKSL